MVYAQLDNRFHDHPKVLALLEHEDDGLAAIGLWTLTITWAHSHVDPACPREAGRIPASLPRRLGGHEDLYRLLVAVGLWEATPDGWQIHDFGVRQDITGWQIRSDKARKAAQARWGTRSNATSNANALLAGFTADGDECIIRDEPQHAASSQVDDAPSNAPSNAQYSTEQEQDLEEELLRSSSSCQVSAKPDNLKDRPGGRDDVERVCQHLADRIEEQVGRRPQIGVQWRRSARLLIDLDGHTEAQVHAAIDWCQDDEFWRSNILSMGKLRQQYIRLRAAARSRPQREEPLRGLWA